MSLKLKFIATKVIITNNFM